MVSVIFRLLAFNTDTVARIFQEDTGHKSSMTVKPPPNMERVFRLGDSKSSLSNG